MSRNVVVVLAMLLSGCDAPFWQKQKGKDAEIARQTWRAEENRHLLALCLDIAKFEKQWSNYAEWSFDASTGACSVSYKKLPADVKTRKECAELWLGEGERIGDAPSAKAPIMTRTMYRDCVSETFSRVWNVQVADHTSP